MASNQPWQGYCHCGTHLAKDNRGYQCARCERLSRDKLNAPPEVPPEFWQTEQFEEAFAAQHMGWVSRAYRTHPYHHAVYGPGGISQTLLGQWVGLLQPHLSRFETGPPTQHLDTLRHWASVLRIPAELLWFKLSKDKPRPQTIDAVLSIGADENLTPSRQSFSGRKSQAQTRLRGLLATIDEERGSLDRALATRSVNSDQLDQMEESVTTYAADCVKCPPIGMLCRLTLDLTTVRSLINVPQPPRTMHRLYRVTAGLSVLLADEFMVLGDIYSASSWYGTARTAAKQTSDIGLRATVLTLSAMLPLYWGRPKRAAELAGEAAALISNAPSAGNSAMPRVMAPSIQALALAQAGDHQASVGVLMVARRAFDASGTAQQVESVFGFSERRFRFYEGKTLLRIGRHSEANSAFDAALRLYPEDVPGDPALIHLEKAASMVSISDTEQGAKLAASTLTALPMEHRADIFMNAGRAVFGAVPANRRDTTAVRDLDELLRSLKPVSVE